MTGTYGQALWVSAQVATGGLIGITLSECLKEGLHVPLRDIKELQEPVALPPELQLYRVRARHLWRARWIDLGVIALGAILAIYPRTRFLGIGVAGVAIGRLLLQFEAGELQSQKFRCPLNKKWGFPGPP